MCRDTLLVLLCLSVPAVRGQCPVPSAGPLAGAPVLLSVDPITSFPIPRPDELDLKQPGFTGNAPAPIFGPGRPDFRPAALWYPPLRACNPTGMIDVDAVSIGLDWVPATPAGFVFVAPGNFALLTYSVTRSTLGVPGGVVACEVANPNGAAGDIFSYTFLGSALPPALVDRVFRTNDASEIALPVAPASPNLDSLDHFAAIYDLLFSAGVPLPPAVTVYFSLAPASVPLVPPSWWLQNPGGGPVPTAPSAASILRTTWNPLTLAWSCPDVWRSHADLGLAPGENLDALAVDLQQGYLLFSTSAPSGGAPDPLMFGNLAATPLATSVFRYSGTPAVAVSTRLELGTGSGDVDGICALDPGGNPRRQSLDPLLTVYGRIESPLFPTINAPWVGSYRMNRNNSDVLRTFSIGGPRPGIAFMFFSPPPPLHQTPFWFNPIIQPAGTGGSSALGQPTVLDLPIPPGTQGFVFSLHWVDVSQNLLQIAPASPLTVRL